MKTTKTKIGVNEEQLKLVLTRLNGVQQVAFESAVKQANELVNEVESRMATTKDHYGDYMALISKPIDLLVFQIAGANPRAIGSVKQIYGW